MVFKKIIEHLNSKLNDSGSIILIGNSTAKLDRKNFYGIADKLPESKIAFVDGGNAEILKAANFSLQLIRVYYAIYEKNKRVKNNKHEFYCLVNAKNKNGKIVYEIETFNTFFRVNHEFDSFDSTLAETGHRAEPGRIAEAVRKFAELKTAEDLVSQLDPGDIIVRDGDLECGITHEQEHYGQLKETAGKKGVIVCGLSKTTRIITDSGNSVTGALKAIEPEGAWVYPALPNTSFVKLHPQANYIFRLDLCEYKHLEKILPLLKANSKDPCFLGYPYGLVDADRLARVTTKEKEQIRITLMSKGGNRFRSHLASMDAHDSLNRII